MTGIKEKWSGLRKAFSEDENFTRGRRSTARFFKNLPRSAGRYFRSKVPVVDWISYYAPAWIADDIIAGLSVALLLVPQALLFSSIAGIPLQQGLLAAWAPSALYFIMGTSKDISPGPTLISATFTALAIVEFREKGILIPPFAIASGLSFGTGVLGLIFGLFNLGFLLDLVSLPVILAFMTVAGVKIVQNQLPLLLGMQGVTQEFKNQIPDMISKIKRVEPYAIGVSMTALVVMGIMAGLGKKFGHVHPIIRLVCNSRHAFALLVATAVSIFVNKKLIIPQWPTVGDVPAAVVALQSLPPTDVMPAFVFGGFTIFLATAAEHLVIAKHFARANHYEIDPSQELVFLGLSNLVNAGLGGMVTGGNFDRAAVNSASGVRSPLSAIIVSGFVLIGFRFLNYYVKFVPIPAIAAVIMATVGELIPPFGVLKIYWNISFADFFIFFMALNAGFGQTLETTLGFGVFMSVTYTILRILKTYVRPVPKFDIENRLLVEETAKRPFLPRDGLSPEVLVCELEGDVSFLNADRLRRSIMDTVLTHHSPLRGMESRKPRMWSDQYHRRVARLRSQHGINTPDRFIPALHVLILDWSRVNFVDATGFQALMDLKIRLHIFSGAEEIEIRFVGMNKWLMRRFQRAGWPLATQEEALAMDEEAAKEARIGIKEMGSVRSEDDDDKSVTEKTGVSMLLRPDIVCEDLRDAVCMPRRYGAVRDSGLASIDFGFGDEKYQRPVIVTNVITRGGKVYKWHKVGQD